MKRNIILLVLIFTLSSLYSVQLKIVDQHDIPLPYVRVTDKDILLATSDSLGIVVFDVHPHTELTFSRLGVKTLVKKASDLHAEDIVRLETVAIAQEAINIYGKATDREPFTLSRTQRIDVSSLNKAYATVDDLFRDISAIQVKGLPLTGERQTISLGGHQSRHTVVMLDNVVLNPSGQAVDLSSIPAMDIETIEIVRNNVSVETGSGGVGGVVILHTRKNRAKNEFYLSENIGAFDSVKQNIGFSLYQRGFSLLVNTSSVYTKNDFDYTYRDETLKRENNSKKIFNINSDLAWQSPTQNIQYSVKYQKFMKYLPGPVNYLLNYAGAYQDGSSTHHILFYNLSSGLSRLETQAYLLQNQSVYNNTATSRPTYRAKDENIQSMTGIKTTARQAFQLGSLNIAPALGAEYKKETFAINDLYRYSKNLPEIYRETNSLYGSTSLKYDFNDWEPELVGSIRWDDTSQLGSQQTYRLESNNDLYIGIPLMVNANIGTSYMIPSFYDMYWIGDSQTTGNPDLKPEKAKGWRVEVATDTNPSLNIAKWENRTEYLIFWERSPLGWKPNNITTAHLDSWEVTGAYQFLGNQNITVNYTRTIALDITKGSDYYGKNIVYTPPWLWNIDLNLHFGQLSQNFSYYAQGTQHDNRLQMIPPAIKPYELYHARSTYEIVSGSLTTTINLQVYNIFDTRYQNYAYMPEPGRHWEVSVGVRF